MERHTVRIVASDGSLAAEVALDILVEDVNEPPYFTGVDLGGRVDFMLSATVTTTSPRGTIVAKAFPGGLWRDGAPNGQAKLLFLRDGLLCFDIGWVGSIAARPV